MPPEIVVVGSANTDMIVQVARLPAPGETVLGGRFVTARGGKGANQAVAAARLGAAVTFVARLGRDAFGQECFDAYQAESIATDYIAWDEREPSGVALILVDPAGENVIAVAPGANAALSPADVAAAEGAIRRASCLLLQLEIPLETVAAAVELASRHGVRVLLNPAPAARLPADLLRKVDVLTPNQQEAALLASEFSAEPEGEAWQVLSTCSGVRQMVVTLGAEGALIAGQRPRRVPAFPVQPVDATGAGDAFNGGLAVALAQGQGLEQAVRYACAAGALSATRLGAQPSLPTAAEVAALLGAAG
jgi:ribokinase